MCPLRPLPHPQVEASAFTALPVISIYTVDASEQPVGTFDTQRWRVDIDIWSGDGTGLEAVPLVSASNTTRSGNVQFGKLVLAAPKVLCSRAFACGCAFVCGSWSCATLALDVLTHHLDPHSEPSASLGRR